MKQTDGKIMSPLLFLSTLGAPVYQVYAGL